MNECVIRRTSQVFAKVAAALREDGITRDAVAAELNIPVQEIEQLVFGLLLTGVTDIGGSRKATGRSKPKLYAVK